MALNLGRTAGSVLVGIATALAIVATSVLVFLNPLWVGFEQARTGADRFTGYSLDEVHTVTNAVLGELIFGPATFLQQVAGVGVFDPRERQHLADVHGVLFGFFAVAVIAVVGLVGAAAWSRGRPAVRARVWQAVGAGAAVLGVAVVVVGAFFAVFFDTAFDLFHRVFFASGSYTFDPLQERLVQLFPEDFWSETSIALAVVILAVSALVSWLAFRRMAAAVSSAAGTTAAPAPAPAGVHREGVA